jgi:hypothetical protein
MVAMRASLVGTVSGALTLFIAPGAPAAGPFVDAPLTLPPWHFSADAGVGFGTFQSYGPNPSNPDNPPVLQGGTQLGWGMNLEAAVGLPFRAEIGLRIGYRFGSAVAGNEGASVPAGALGNADHFARLFDPISSEPGLSSFANPEVRLRDTVFDSRTVQVGLETRIIVPTADGAVFGLTPGVPLRIHLPDFVRIDTGLYLPIAFFSDTSYSLDIPVQAFFQLGDAFVGPMTGIRYNVLDVPGEPNTVDIPLGIGGGYTLGGCVDLKAQIRVERINDTNWASQFLGGAVGAGLRLP